MIKANSATPRIAVIGCGAIAELYHLPALVRIPGIREQLILVDSQMARARAMAEKFSIREIHGDLKPLIGRIDGVVVATPPASHYPICADLLENSIHVLCEKPLAETYDEASRLVQLARAAGVTLSANQTRRMFPTYQRIRQLIAEGTLGELLKIRYHEGIEFCWPAATSHHFAQGAKGAWSDTGIHLLDTICWWLDAQPELVDSYNDSFGGPEAVASVRLRYQQADIDLKVSRLGRLSNRFRIEGTQGTIDAGNEDWRALTIQFHNGRRRRLKLRCSATGYNDFARPLMDNFIRVLRGQSQPLIPAESVLPGVALMEESYTRARRFAMPWNAVWEPADVA